MYVGMSLCVSEGYVYIFMTGNHYKEDWIMLIQLLMTSLTQLINLSRYVNQS